MEALVIKNRSIKTDWKDQFSDIGPKDHILVYWQNLATLDLIRRETVKADVYEVLNKVVERPESSGVRWFLKDLETGDEKIVPLNLHWDTHTAYTRKISPIEVLAFKADPQVLLDPPPRNPVDLRDDYAYEFDEQGGKYPRPAKLKKSDPVVDSRYRLTNEYEGESGYAVVVRGIELWGAGKPRSVAYTREGMERLERRTTEYFARHFKLL